MAYDEVGAGDFINAETMNFVIQRQVNRPAVRLVLIANQSIANGTPTLVLFGSGTETMDDLGWHNTGTNTSRITPLYAGRYFVTAWVSWPANATGDRRLALYKNATGFGAYDIQPARAGGQTYCKVTDIVEADGVSDYFELNVFQNSGGALNLLGAGDAAFSTGFVMTFLGEDT